MAILLRHPRIIITPKGVRELSILSEVSRKSGGLRKITPNQKLRFHILTESSQGSFGKGASRARVVAFLGHRKVPASTTNKLIDNMINSGFLRKVS